MKVLESNVTGVYLKDKSRPDYPVYASKEGSFTGGEVEVSKEALNSIGNYSIAYYNGGRLLDENIVGFTDTICLDFDSTLYLEPLLEKLEGYKYIISTTASHKKKGDRYRVFLELDKEYGTKKLELYPYLVTEVIKLLEFERYTDESVDNRLSGILFRSPSDMEYYSGDGKQLPLRQLMKQARLIKFKKDEAKAEAKVRREANRIATQSGVYANDIEIELSDGNFIMLSEAEGNESCICPTCNEREQRSGYIFLDEDTDLPVIHCRRNHCGATHKLREIPKIIDFRTIEPSDEEQSVESKSYKDLSIVNLPLDTDIVQYSLEKTWTTVPYGHYPSKFRDAHKAIFSSLNTVINNNNEGRGGRYIIPAPTGIGKTAGTAHYVAELVKNTPLNKLGVCIVTKFKSEGVDFEKEINRLVGYDIASAINGDNYVAPKDYRNYPIIIITHVNFENKIRETQSWATEHHLIRREHEGERFNRNLLIIDEALSLIEEDSVSTNSLDELIFQLETCKNAVGIPFNSKQQEDFQFIKALHKQMIEIGNTVSTMEIKTVALQLTSYTIGMSDYGGDVDFTKELRDWVESKELEPHKMSLKLGQRLTKQQYKLKDRELRNRWLGELDKVDKALNQTDWATYRDSELTFWSIMDVFPNKMSYAILDATGHLDYTLQLENNTQDINVVEGFEGLRSYDNFTLHYIRMRTGKTHLKKNPEILPRFIALGNKLNPQPEEPTIIATAKDFRERVISMIGEDKELFKQAHFGNVTGKNLWKDCKMGIYLGQFHKPYYFSKNRIALATSSNDMVDMPKSVDDTYNNYNIVQDFIQLINRQNIRVVNDLDGGCADNTALCSIPDGSDGDLMIEIIKKVMPGIVLNEVPYNELGLIEPAKYKGNSVTTLIEALERVVYSTGIEKSIKVMRDEAGIDLEAWKNMKRGKHFMDNLHKAGYDLVKTRGSTPRFIKIDKVEE